MIGINNSWTCHLRQVLLILLTSNLGRIDSDDKEKLQMKRIYLFSFLLFFASCSLPKNHYLLSCENEGWILIVYGQEPAPKLTKIDGMIQIFPDSNGIVLTSSDPNRGMLDTKFFCKKPNGAYEELPLIRSRKEVPLGKIVSGYTIGVSCYTELETCFEFDAIRVGNSKYGSMGASLEDLDRIAANMIHRQNR
jgi:hypothetical protein